MAIPAQNRFAAKMPSDVRRYAYDFTALVGGNATSSPSASVFINNNGVACGAGDITQPVAAILTGNVVTATLAGGTLGTDYIVSFTISLSDAEQITRSAFLFVGQS